jgi:hypothetical protein
VPSNNTTYNSLFRVTSTEGPKNQLFFPSKAMYREGCPTLVSQYGGYQPKYPLFYTKASGYATSEHNASGRPGCVVWAEQMSASEAKSACNNEPKCAGYYESEARKSFVLSLAGPGKCTVDWKPVKNSEQDACRRLLGIPWRTSGNVCTECASTDGMCFTEVANWDSFGGCPKAYEYMHKHQGLSYCKVSVDAILQIEQQTGASKLK